MPGPHARSFSTSPRSFSGVTVGAKRATTLPSLPIRNLVKFHLIDRLPRMPLAWVLSHL